MLGLLLGVLLAAGCSGRPTTAPAPESATGVVQSGSPVSTAPMSTAPMSTAPDSMSAGGPESPSGPEPGAGVSAGTTAGPAATESPSTGSDTEDQVTAGSPDEWPITATTTTATTTEVAPTTSDPSPIASNPPAASTPPAVKTPTPSTPLPVVAGTLPDIAGISGVNEPDCRSSHRPVVLLHGTLGSVAASYGPLVTGLRADDRCVYGLDYGSQGVGPVADSARAFAQLVEAVRRRTGAPTVDVIGYSQGGLVLRTALRFDGLADRVRVAVLLAPSFHGTDSPLVAQVPAFLCPACRDQTTGSPLLRQLDTGGDLDGSVRYAVLSTRDDTVVTPVSAQPPRGPADRVDTLVVQDRCPAAMIGHVALPAEPGTIAWVLAALDTDGHPPASAYTC